MKRLVDLVKLDRLDHLIRKAATGRPDDLAELLDISRSTLFEMIKFLRDDMRAPVIYSTNRASYMYTYTPKFYLGFERKQTDSKEKDNTYGGNSKEENNDQAEIENDEEMFCLDDGIRY